MVGNVQVDVFERTKLNTTVNIWLLLEINLWLWRVSGTLPKPRAT
jgi:hypothetical protein